MASREAIVRTTDLGLGFAMLGSVTLAVACQTPPDRPQAGDAVEGITAESLLEHTRILASDEFAGRAPGSDGEERTVEYLTEAFGSHGLSPGNPDGTWVQSVPLVGLTPAEGSTLTVASGGESRTLVPGEDYVASTRHVVEHVSLDGELVFVGYGAVAPEYEWDDFKDVDVTGKVLLMLVNDPPRDDVFGGPAMTYYGRWTYKFEIASERGAAGVFVIHETGPAGYPWEVIGGSPTA